MQDHRKGTASVEALILIIAIIVIVGGAYLINLRPRMDTNLWHSETSQKANVENTVQ